MKLTYPDGVETGPGGGGTKADERARTVSNNAAMVGLTGTETGSTEDATASVTPDMGADGEGETGVTSSTLSYIVGTQRGRQKERATGATSGETSDTG